MTNHEGPKIMPGLTKCPPRLNLEDVATLPECSKCTDLVWQFPAPGNFHNDTLAKTYESNRTKSPP